MAGWRTHNTRAKRAEERAVIVRCQLDFYGIAIDYLVSRAQRQRKFGALVSEASRWGLDPFTALGLNQNFSVTYVRHNPPTCPKCHGEGFVEVYSPRPPAFEECDLCGNPAGHPLP